MSEIYLHLQIAQLHWRETILKHRSGSFVWAFVCIVLMFFLVL